MKLESYLLRPITEFTSENIYSKNGSNSVYTVETHDSDFFGVRCDSIFLTEQNGIIRSVSFTSRNIFNSAVITKMSESYGKPDSILALDQPEHFEKTTSEATGQHFEEGVFSTKEGSLDDDPTAIFWNKVNYQIRLIYNYPKGKTDITFEAID